MAILNGIPLVNKGRIGDFTIYQRDGKMQVRSRYNEPRHHRRLSEKQLRQCVRMGNNVALWHAFPQRYRPYFQFRRKGVTCFNMFVTYAMQAHPVYLSKQSSRGAACVVTDVLVSQGSLNDIVVGHDGVAPVTNILLGGLAIDNDTTVRQFSQAVIDNNYDYRPGDRLRYYLCQQRILSATGEPVVRIYCQELVLDLMDSTPLHLAVDESNGFAQRGGRLAAVGEVTGGMAWVHIRPDEEGMMVSTQRLVCNNGQLMEQYGSEEALAEAGQSYC